MPQVVAGAALSALVSGSWIAGGSLIIGFSMSSFLTSVALGGLTHMLNKKPKSQSTGSISEGITRQFRQAVVGRQVVYGEVRKSGGLAMVSSSTDNQYMYYIIMLASHEIDGVYEYIVNDQSIPLDALDANGNVTTGDFANHIRFRVNTGADDQAADSVAVSEVPEWTSSHTLSGIAYLYVRLKWNRDVFPDGVPNISVWMRGKKITDTRNVIDVDVRATEDGDTRITEDGVELYTDGNLDTLPRTWTPNIALQAADNLMDTQWGFKADFEDISQDVLNATANLCDEIVQTKAVIHDGLSVSNNIITLDGDTLQFFRGDRVEVTSSSFGGLTNGTYYVIPYQRHKNPRIKLASSFDNAIAGTAITITGTGTCDITKTGEPRYHGGGTLEMTDSRQKNIEDILTGMGGVAYRTGTQYMIKAASYDTPVYSFSENDMIGGIELFQAKVTRRDRFNQVQGKYISQLNGGNEADYPLVKSTTYITSDGEDLKRELDLPFTHRPQTAQRIGKTAMERARQEFKFRARFNLTAMKLAAGDNFYFSFAPWGWVNKVFEVTKWSMGEDKDTLFVEIEAHENASAVYDFTSADDESLVDPALNTTLANPRYVPPVGLFGLTSIPVFTAGGDRLYKIQMSWEPSESQYVLSGGRYQIQYKQSSDSEWTGNQILDGSATETELFQSQIDVLYDIRIRAMNSLVSSAWTTIEGFLAGSSVVATQYDYESDTGTSQDFETGTGTAQDWENDS